MPKHTSHQTTKEMHKRPKKSRERQIADKLVKQHELNEKLKEKKIANNFWKFFK
jgi:hypothetical protein